MTSPSAALFWLFLLAAGSAVSQYLAPPTDLTSITSQPGNYKVRYKQVPPGICEQRDDIKSISGYVDVSANQHIFFWFFEARNADPTTAPLTTWINGGPGASSMIGVFQEVGPCSVNQHGNVVDNIYSWTNVSNLLFIDQPVQTGFSYSNTTTGYISQQDGSVVVTFHGYCPSDQVTNQTCGTYSDPSDLAGVPVSTMTAASSFYATLQGFLQVFPQYARAEFNFATESYGGHFGPVFAEYIEAMNARPGTSTTKISLKSLTIVNGWINPLIQYPAYYNFTVFPGNTYDYTPYNQSYASGLFSLVYGPGGCVDLLNRCVSSGTNQDCSQADSFCLKYVETFYDVFAGHDESDIREPAHDPYPSETYVRYLNDPTVQAAIGAYVNYTEQSVAVAEAFNTTGDDGRLDGTTNDLLALVEQGVAVTMIYGDADYNSKQFLPPLPSPPLPAPIPTPGYVNISTDTTHIHGQAKQSGAFAFARIYNSGHEVPYYQPEAALTIFSRAINGRDIATGQTVVGRDFVTEGPAQSTYREGNATVRFNTDVPAIVDEPSVASSVASGRRLLLDGLTLVGVNGTTKGAAAGAAPHGDGEGVMDPDLKLKVEQMVHITQRRRRRGRSVDG